ncbi:MAG TPA: type III pantothenate kinase [Gemmatales bacterium]|nr:type III pantothenate kinase [Gemmatales bacterium]
MKQADLVVVDVGNSACKVGLVQAEALLDVHHFTLEECAHQPWRHRAVHELSSMNVPWILSGSNPPIINSFASWLTRKGQVLRIIDSDTSLPIKIDVEFPERVGRDRLLNALAIEQVPAIIISAGTAVTVDAVDKDGRFLGGAIFPGLYMMAKSLHDYTAKLPMIDTRSTRPTLPGKNTDHAMHAGIIYAVLGGIIGCVNEMLPKLSKAPSRNVTIYLTGGDGPYVQSALPWPVIAVPSLSLQGIIVASRTLSP